MKEALRRNPDADYAVHCGDGAPDFLALMGSFPNTTPVAVCGNCDLSNNLPLECELVVCGVRVLIVHGHKYGVKFSPLGLVPEARRRGCGLVLFGHTHEKYEKYIAPENGGTPLYLFNPGTVRAGDFGLAEITEKGILLSHGSVFD